jgi:putative CocE/NonD family hydrolase
VTTVLVEHDIRVPMRDGVTLAADLYRPDVGTSVPALLTRTPYGPVMAQSAYEPERLARAGFAVLVQHCRGRFGSEGDWTYVHCEVEDGYDTVEWAAAQPWCDGRVGMFGQSYAGNTQWLAAQSRPPHLVALAPEACAADYWEGTFGTGGAFRLALRVGWTAVVIGQMARQWGIVDPELDHVREVTENLMAAQRLGDATLARKTARDTLDRIFRTRPLRDNPLWHARASWLDEAFEHESRHDSTWLRFNPTTHYSAIGLPALHIGSWYDIHLGATLRHYTGMRDQAPGAPTQRLIIGPWDHWHPREHVVGDLDFGPAAAVDITKVRLDWFRRWLLDQRQPDQPPVRIFVMGENVWRDEPDWPLARTQYTSWYLHSNGTLAPTPPSTTDGFDQYTHDPRHPVPTTGGPLLGSGGEQPGPLDQREVASRADVLTYTSEPLDREVELTGPVTVDLWASTTAPDTDFVAVLVDVHPDGRMLNLCEGAVRARHVLPNPPLVTGAVYHFGIDLAATSVLLAPGNRIALHISSSSFPAIEPNPGTGNPLGTDTDADLRPAQQAIHHDRAHPSRVVLPVTPR